MKITTPLITLTTDFGWEDGYVGAVKGAILSVNPQAMIVDLSHGVPSFDIERGAFLLGTTFSLFPSGTIHVAVVDPGVGSSRRPLLVVTPNYLFVAPDNGILTLAAQRDPPREIYELTREEFFRPEPSHTFHGRDIFGPVAAHLARGIPPSRFGVRRRGLTRLESFVSSETPVGRIGQILFFDKFGNAITNLSATAKRPGAGGVIFRRRRLSIHRTYSEIPPGRAGAVWGSSGFLELALTEGSFQSRFGASKGEGILLKRGGVKV